MRSITHSDTGLKLDPVFQPSTSGYSLTDAPWFPFVLNTNLTGKLNREHNLAGCFAFKPFAFTSDDLAVCSNTVRTGG